MKVKTMGLVEAEIVSEPASDDMEHHYFELIAPAMGRYRYRLLDAWHNSNLVYPVWVDTPDWDDESRECSSQLEFTEALAAIFSS